MNVCKRYIFTATEKAKFLLDGVILQENILSESVVANILTEIEIFTKTSSTEVVTEDGSNIPRGAHGLHFSKGLLGEVVSDSFILGGVQQLLGNDVYIHQSKVNFKHAFAGESWPWHQDMIYWENGDGIKFPNLVNVAILLDDVTQFNGPLFFVKGSHIFGNLCAADQLSTDWKKDVSAKLPYTVSNETLKKLSKTLSFAAGTGGKGSLLWFHPQIVHASTANLSPFNRTLYLLTYNSCSNVPTLFQRPSFLCSRSFQPVVANTSLTHIKH